MPSPQEPRGARGTSVEHPDVDYESAVLAPRYGLYLTGSALLALLMLFSSFLVDQSLGRQLATAHIVNLSGRQRMLTQHISKMCIQMAVVANGLNPRLQKADIAQDTQAVRKDLLTSIQLMRESRTALVDGSASIGIPPTTDPVILRIYNEEPYLLTPRLDAFLTHASRFATSADDAARFDAPDLTFVEAASEGPLLKAIQASVLAYQVQGESDIHFLHRFLSIVKGLMVAVLLAIAVHMARSRAQRKPFPSASRGGSGRLPRRRRE